MHYMLLFYRNEQANRARSEADVQATMATHLPYIERLRRNQSYVGSGALVSASEARTLRSTGGKPVVTEGPFAESREQLAGYYVLEASDLDQAVALASECPLPPHVVATEIRPIPAVASAEGPPESPSAGQRFLLTIYRDETAAEKQSESAKAAAIAKWGPYIQRLREGGHFAGAEPLALSGSATTLRQQNGKLAMTDGPFAETREQLGGYCVVVARDLDQATQLAAECPDAVSCAIEVRQIRSAQE
jgi:hypothetical protein